MIFRFVFPLLGLLGRHLGRLEALLGRLGDLLGPSEAVLEQFLELLGRSWSVGKPKQREAKDTEKNSEDQRCWPLGALLGRLLGRVAGIMELSRRVWGASWKFLRLSMRGLERSLGVLGGLQPIKLVSGAVRESADPPKNPGGAPWRRVAPPRAAPWAYSDINNTRTHIHIHVHIQIHIHIHVHIQVHIHKHLGADVVNESRRSRSGKRPPRGRKRFPGSPKRAPEGPEEAQRRLTTGGSRKHVQETPTGIVIAIVIVRHYFTCSGKTFPEHAKWGRFGLHQSQIVY